MKWKKLGLVYGPDGSLPWARYAALQPTPIILSESTIRVFIGLRDESGTSRIGYVDLASDNPTRVLGCCGQPVLDIGAPGMFDEDGVVPCAILRQGALLYLYYAGYQRPRGVRFIAFGGLAISDNGGTHFRRASRIPITDRTQEAPLFRVIHSLFEENGRWRAWYGAGEQFLNGTAKTLPSYDIRYMESADGVHFPEIGTTVLSPENDEHRVGRPTVVRWRDGRYLMFYGFGTEQFPYRLGLAVSSDGYKWKRRDADLGLELSDAGWDSEMMAYPAIVSTAFGVYLFYNGNDYGRSGFGVAVLEE